MIRKIVYIIVITLFFQTVPAIAGSVDSEELKNKSADTADECFEGFSRAMFKLNNGLDKVIFKPVA